MSDFVKVHGIRIAANGSIQNLVVERLAEDPAVTEPGRIWFNTSENEFKASFPDGIGGFTVRSLINTADFTEFIAQLASTQGASLIGFEGYTSSTGTISVPSGSVEDALGTIIEKMTTVEASAAHGVIVKDEGTLVLDGANTLNFVGEDVLAVRSGTGEVTIYVPAPDFAPMYNQDTGTVPNVTTTARRISNPTMGRFDIGNWSPASSQQALTNTTLAYNSPTKVGFLNEETTLTATVLGADGVTPLATHSLANVGPGSGSSSLNGITIEVSGWETDYFRFKANVNVTINLAAIIPNGGRFSVKIDHDNGILGTFTKTQGPMLFDPDAPANRPSINAFGIEKHSVVSNRWLSGVRYFSTGDQFKVTVDDIDRINEITWPNDNNVIRVLSNTEYGIPDFWLQANATDIQGWTHDWDVMNLSAEVIRSISRSNFRFIGTTAKIQGRWVDWINGTLQNSPTASVLIDTHGVGSTNLAEEFTDEARRLIGGSWAAWDPTAQLGAGDLMVINGTLRRQYGNWTTYQPTNIANYAGTNTQNQVFFREFIGSGANSNGLFHVGGVTEANLTNEQVKIWISTNGIAWYDCGKDYISGSLSDGDGCRINRDTRPIPNIEFTLGTGGSTDANSGTGGFGLFVRIEIPSGSSVAMSHIRLVNW
jgi:hypothetical protein